ncbi:hypothetical protein HFP57_01645 [Parasphingopyxis algicola]|uniref:hypothetical protein n=1 Tax=Parasphingopyxis algicola TaxID=2026624 RepID=UPI00159F7ED4|nr:hypothetical protein [Parasphingopyxis algicola]QLC23862.1 hypothetical protein HFP57_01645 [Parasphingopyxis algicola]
MKRILIIAGVLALGACAESAPEAEPAVEAVEEEAATDWSAWVGSYDIAYDDGGEAALTIADGGTYEFVTGDETRTGTVEMGDGGAICYTNDDGETPTECWINSAAAEDGSWRSTSDQGETVTVSRVAADAETEA